MSTTRSSSDLGKRIAAATAVTVFAVVISTAVGLVVQRHVIGRQGVEMTHETMRSAVLEAENARDSISALGEAKAFDIERLKAEARGMSDYRSTTLYRTVPVVAAWNAIQKAADAQGYQFRVVRENARNPNNEPRPEELELLRGVATGQDYFKVDDRSRKIIFARPVRLTRDCLSCHGDPANSASGDGKDILGMRMEGWKEGEIRGAFVLTSGMDKLDAVVWAGMKKTLYWMVPMVLLLAPGFFVLNRVLIVKPLAMLVQKIQKAGRETDKASANISESGQSLASSASEQAASLEEISATLEEISATAQANRVSAQTAREVAAQTRGAAETGATQMSEMLNAMEAIKRSSNDVARIIRTVDEIAFQTNLLALNAAVEAARAGEAGAGFAVVADEVRNLAHRSSDAAKETATLIEGAVKRTEEGVLRSSEIGETLRQIVGHTRRVDEAVSQITIASEEQHDGLKQLNTGVAQLSTVTQALAAAAEHSATDAVRLSEQTHSLQDTVASLASVVGQTDVG